MENVQKSFLNFLNFTDLENWSSYSLLGKKLNYTQKFPFAKIGSFLKRNKTPIDVIDGQLYKRATIKINGQGIFLRDIKDGKEIGTKKQFLISKGQFLLSKIDARNGAFGVVPEELEGAIITGNFWTFDVDYSLVNPFYLTLLTGTKEFQKLSQTASVGTTNRNYLQEVDFLNFKVPLPTLQEQQEIVEAYFSKINEAKQLELEANQQINNLDLELGIYTSKNIFKTNVINIINYYELDKWGVDKNQLSSVNYNGKFQVLKIKDICLIGSGGTPSRSRKEYYNGTIPWIKTGEVLDDIIYDTEEKITIEAINNSSAKLYKKDSIIIAMYGQGKTRGRTAKLGIDATTNQACAVLYNVNNQVIVNDYLWIFLMNEYDRIRELASGNSQPNLNADMIKNYPIVVPPLENQKEIISKYWEFDKIKKLKIKNAEQLKHQANEEFEKAIFQ